MTRGEILKLSRTDVYHRAYQAITGCVFVDGRRLPIAYRLKEVNGGFDPAASHCAGISTSGEWKGYPTADCIGFALWASGIDRKQPGYKGTAGEWLHCPSLLADAKGAQKYCRVLKPGETAKIGDWLLNKNHIGVIIRTDAYGPAHLVADCSPRHRRRAKVVTDPAIGVGYAWAADCIVVRPLHYVDV